MFQISTLEDPAVRVAPANLALTQLEAITQQIEATYVDKARARSHAALRSAPCAALLAASRAPRPRSARAAMRMARALLARPMR
jgi:hypothetical protein